jgi:hypothetical protein
VEKVMKDSLPYKRTISLVNWPFKGEKKASTSFTDPKLYGTVKCLNYTDEEPDESLMRNLAFICGYLPNRKGTHGGNCGFSALSNALCGSLEPLISGAFFSKSGDPLMRIKATCVSHLWSQDFNLTQDKKLFGTEWLSLQEVQDGLMDLVDLNVNHLQSCNVYVMHYDDDPKRVVIHCLN